MNITPNTVAQNTLPVMVSKTTESPQTEIILRQLRHFHLGDESAASELPPINSDLLPAFLASYRDKPVIRHAYPLRLSTSLDQPIAQPLTSYIQTTIENMDIAADVKRILTDNAPRIEKLVNQALLNTTMPLNAFVIFEQAGQQLQQELHLDESNNERLTTGIKQLLTAITHEASLLGYSPYTAIHLLIHTIQSNIVPQRQALTTVVQNIIKKLKLLQEVEQSKSIQAKAPEALSHSVGKIGSRLLDSANLAALVKNKTGSKPMTEARLARIQNTINTLSKFKHLDTYATLIYTHDFDFSEVITSSHIQLVSETSPFDQVEIIFKEVAQQFAQLFSAIRIGNLEIDSQYDEAIHDPWFANFTWEAFSKEEVLQLPTICLIESGEKIFNQHLQHLPRLLNSGKPIMIFTEVEPGNNYASAAENPLTQYRTELSLMGISHRQAIVTQSCASRPEHLIEGYQYALQNTRTSLHVISSGMHASPIAQQVNPWLLAGAAIESRAHPLLQIKQENDQVLQILLTNNPQPDADWPVYPMAYTNGENSPQSQNISFTFIDFALLESNLNPYFRMVPAGLDNEKLIPVTDYFALSADDMISHIPYIWAVDKDSTLQKVVVSRALILATKDRLNTWQTLQEMSGVKNQYVLQAIESARIESEAIINKAHEQQEEAHQQAITQARNEAAGEVMQKLTNMLLSIDMTATTQNIQTSPAATNSSETVVPEMVSEQTAIIAEPEPEEEPVSFDEPWIDSILCTTCDECIIINPIVFLYNEDKQAYLGDVNTGTYAQMVESAEKCPARCIHPGKPLNPNEPNLDELIERAAAFN